MGLDNGIMLKIKNREAFGDIPTWLNHQPWDSKNEYEITYWRKCWNIRNTVLNLLCWVNQNGTYTLSLDNFKLVIREIKPLLTKKGWNDSESIWSYNEIKRHYRHQLKHAAKIAKWLEDKPEDSYEIYFYDSY